MKTRHVAQPSLTLCLSATVASAAFKHCNLAFKWNKWVIREILRITIIIIFPVVTNATLWLDNGFLLSGSHPMGSSRARKWRGSVSRQSVQLMRCNYIADCLLMWPNWNLLNTHTHTHIYGKPPQRQTFSQLCICMLAHQIATWCQKASLLSLVIYLWLASLYLKR